MCSTQFTNNNKMESSLPCKFQRLHGFSQIALVDFCQTLDSNVA